MTSPKRQVQRRQPKESPSPPGAIVLRIPAGDGKETIQIQEINGLDPLSVPTLLRLAATIKEKGVIPE